MLFFFTAKYCLIRYVGEEYSTVMKALKLHDTIVVGETNTTTYDGKVVTCNVIAADSECDYVLMVFVYHI